jgi:Transcriptional regulators containing a DNA-binding HTH domain and an aminotransferase domain (MocR family) and their eukaryotic orthologs
MAQDQSTLLRNLHLSVTVERGTLTQQLEHQIKEGIRQGRLHVGAELPSSRELARHLGCSRWVVVQAYEQLAAEGYLVASRGSATRIAPQLTHAAPRTPARETTPPVRFDFHPGIPDLTRFPREAWVRSYRKALANVLPDTLNYHDPAGVTRLRATLASYLGRARAVVTTEQGVMLTAGTNHALGIIGRALHRAGITDIAVESPGWVPLRNPFDHSGLTVHPVTVDRHGVRVDLIPPGVRAIHVTPAHQFPSGALMSPERRTELMEWARTHDAVIIEDDYDAEFRYDRRPVGTLQGLDPAHVIYAGTLSKTLAPGMRLGWMVVPEAWQEALADERRGVDGGVSTLEQLALAEFMESSDFERHLRMMRREYRTRRGAFLEAVSRHLPSATVDGIPAGLHANLLVDVVIDADRFRRELAQRRVRLSLLDEFLGGDRPDDALAERPTHLVMGFGAVPLHQLDEGLTAVAAAVAAASLR